MKIPIRIQQLIAKALRGKISSSEQAELDRWFLENEPKGSEKPVPKRRTKKAYNAILKKIDGRSGNHQPISWGHLAAACLAGLMIFAIWSLPSFESPIEESLSGEMLEKIHNAYGTRKMVKLADGSKIWMRGDTEITISKRFSENRQVWLEGEAFFEVEKDSLHPFTVFSGIVVTEVVGTSFLVSTNSNEENISVKTGKVKVSSSDTLTQKTSSKTLTALEKIKWQEGEGFGKIENVNPERTFAWVEGKLVFSNTAILEVLEELKEWYGLEEVITSGLHYECKVTGTYTRLSLKEVMESIQYATGINYEIYGKKLKVSKGNC